MHAAPRFGLAFGSLVFIRALLDRGSPGIAVTVIMFLFFAGVSGVAYLGASAVIRRRPLLTAALTALALLLLISLPSLIASPLSLMISTRIGLRVLYAWIYVCVLFAGFSRIVGMKLLALALAPMALFGQLVDEYAPPRAQCCLQFSAQALADQLQDWNQLGRYHADNAKLQPQSGRVVFYGDSITDGWKLAQQFPALRIKLHHFGVIVPNIPSHRSMIRQVCRNRDRLQIHPLPERQAPVPRHMRIVRPKPEAERTILRPRRQKGGEAGKLPPRRIASPRRPGRPPLPGEAHKIPGLLQCRNIRRNLRRQRSVQARRLAKPVRILAGQKPRPGRRTRRIRRKRVGKQGPFLRQPVKHRRLHHPVAVGARMRKRPVIRQQQNDIRPAPGRQQRCHKPTPRNVATYHSTHPTPDFPWSRATGTFRNSPFFRSDPPYPPNSPRTFRNSSTASPCNPTAARSASRSNSRAAP